MNRKPISNFLLILTEILSRTVSKLSQIIVQILAIFRLCGQDVKKKKDEVTTCHESKVDHSMRLGLLDSCLSKCFSLATTLTFFKCNFTQKTAVLRF